jgi:hypothetical protein
MTGLYSISCTDSEAYEVVVEIDGERRSMRCRVVEDDGIRVVQPEPDLLFTLPISTRLVVAAVIAFDAAREK